MSATRSGFFGVLGGVVGLIGSSVLAAALVAAMFVPPIAVAAMAADTTAGFFNSLPEYIQLDRQSQQNRIYAIRGGQPVQIATVFDQNRQEVGWDEISPYIKEAAIAGEDHRFYEHGGVDAAAVTRAAVGAVRNGEPTSGASTIDMQLVKNIRVQEALRLDDPAARKDAYRLAIEDSLSRKLKEMKLAIGLNKRYTKRQILLGYLNITGFGGSTYGVETASQQYFSVSAKDVTLAQAASLIAIVQQPSLQNLGDPKLYPANKIRRDQILRDMHRLKYITERQFEEAMSTPIEAEVKITPPSGGCLYGADAKFACDYALRLVPTLASLGRTEDERRANWARGGYDLYTSIDLDQQDVAQANLEKSAPATETRFHLGAAAVSVQPGTGRILLMAQNKGYDNSAENTGTTSTAVNYNTDGAYGGSSGFQTGSAYKIFALTAWLQAGHRLSESVNGTARSFPMASFKTPCVGRQSGPAYSPANDNPREGGIMSVMEATRLSVNAAFVTMAQKLNLCDIRADANAMGVHRADGDDLRVDPSSVLGTNEIAPLSMAEAIATIGANGMYCAPTIIDRVIAPDGTKLAGQRRECTQAIEPNIASTVAYALADVMRAGTGAPGNPRDGVPIVGKTGTTDGSVQNWLVATTTKVALAVWVGNIVGGQSLRRISVAGTNGYNTKFNIFRGTMASLNTNPAYRGADVPAPDPVLIGRQRAALPRTAPAPAPPPPAKSDEPAAPPAQGAKPPKPKK
jgi:membrane peptidoglycan carboxypeptidase